MPVPLIMFLDGLCRRDQPANSAPDLPNTDQLISIDEPVGAGPKAKNLESDVRTIQESLNKIKTGAGGPAKPLVVDGKWLTDPNNQVVEANQFGELNNVVEVD